MVIVFRAVARNFVGGGDSIRRADKRGDGENIREFFCFEIVNFDAYLTTLIL